MDINKDEYYEQVDKIVSMTRKDKQIFEKLYMLATADCIPDENTGKFIDGLIKELFESFYETTVKVPWEFLETPIGKAILKVKFDIKANTYLISDIADLTGIAKQNIGRDIGKKLFGEKRGGVWVFTQKQVEAYINQKQRRKTKEKII